MSISRETTNIEEEVSEIREAINDHGYYIYKFTDDEARTYDDILRDTTSKTFQQAIRLSGHFIVQDSTLHRVLTSVIPEPCMLRWMCQSQYYYKNKALSQGDIGLHGIVFDFVRAGSELAFYEEAYHEKAERVQYAELHFEVQSHSASYTPEIFERNAIVISDATLPMTFIKGCSISVMYVSTESLPPGPTEVIEGVMGVEVSTALWTEKMGVHADVVNEKGGKTYIGYPRKTEPCASK